MRSRRCFLFLALILIVPAGCQRGRKVAPPSPGHSSPTIRYALQRPAASFDAIPPPRFRDVAESAGLDYSWTIPDLRPLTILQSIGNGCAFLDYDQDGSLDILLVGSKLALYKGDGRGRFTSVTAQAGLDRLSGHFLGCAVGDYDNDGFPDVYLSAYRGGVLLHNETGKREKGKGKSRNSPQRHRDTEREENTQHPIPEYLNTRTPKTLKPYEPYEPYFRDVTREAGLAPQPWGTSCAFADLDNDGRLDLYLCNYVVYDTETVTQLCTVGGVQTGCGPTTYQPSSGVLYRNLGGGRFADITRQSGASEVAGKGLGVLGAPLDSAGRIHLAIANDEMPGDLLVPAGNGANIRLANRAQEFGLAFDRDGNVHGGMGIDVGDYDNDGALDMVVTTFQHEARSLYHNDGKGLFQDRGPNVGLGREISDAVGFGCKFLDYNNDGWLDIVIANGHVQDNIQQIHSNATYRQPTHLLHNSGGPYVSFREIGAACPAFQTPLVGRGLAVGDYDNDGRQDILITDAEGRPLLLHNEQSPPGRWLGVRLVGAKSNRDGAGAMVTVTAGKRRWVRVAHTDGSYLSASDPRVHFGLGSVERIETLTVRWPSGHRDTYRNLPTDRYLTLREGVTKVKR